MNVINAETEDGERLLEVGGCILSALMNSSSDHTPTCVARLSRPSTPIGDVCNNNSSNSDYDWLDARYQTCYELFNHAELITRDIYVERCREAKLLDLIDPDHLTKRGLLKLLILENALKETRSNKKDFLILAEDLTDEALRALSGNEKSKCKWISAHLDPSFCANSPTDVLALLHTRAHTTAAFVRTTMATPSTSQTSQQNSLNPPTIHDPRFVTTDASSLMSIYSSDAVDSFIKRLSSLNNAALKKREK